MILRAEIASIPRYSTLFASGWMSRKCWRLTFVPTIFFAFLTRLADNASRAFPVAIGVRLVLDWVPGALAALILLLDSSRAMGQSAAKKSPAPATKAEAGKADNADEQEARTAPAPDVAAPVADPSQTRHVEQIEVFKDPLAEDLLNMGKVISSPVVTITDNEMAQIEGSGGQSESDL